MTAQTLLNEAETLLEFDRVREMLVAHARMEAAKSAILEAKPAWVREDVERLQDETAEARSLLERKGDVGLTGLIDALPLIRRAELAGTLNGVELQQVRAVIDSIRVAKSTVQSMGELTPLLAQWASEIHDLRELSEAVDNSLDEYGNVRDSATPRLGRLRQRVRSSYASLVESLERMTKRSDLKTALQSDVIASRNDRLVLEVRSGAKSLVPGIVHGVSGTGQTIFIEPWAMVDAGNRWREAAAEAEREEAKVLRTLSRHIAMKSQESVASIQAATSIDIAMARARFAVDIRAARISIAPSQPDQSHISLILARHPLLRESVVPVTMRIDRGQRGLVITGPNTGGKTVAMKTLGLLAVMHQFGMQLPCDEATTLPVFAGIYADVGDAQSIDRSVSTFSSHMQRVVQITRAVSQSDSTSEIRRPDSLVLLDELGTGTDMEEGSALARAILDDLVSHDCWVCVTTHHRAVAEFAASHPRIQNASVEVDPQTMVPNYNLIMGAPGRSYAIHVAQRLGLSRPVLTKARGMIDPRRDEAADYLERVRKEALNERERLAELQREATLDRAAARDSQVRATAEIQAAEKERVAMVEQARTQLVAEAQQVRRELRRIIREARSKKTWSEARREVEDVVRPLRSPQWQAPPVADTPNSLPEDATAEAAIETPAPAEPDAPADKDASEHLDQPAPTKTDFTIGDTVAVPSLGVTGTVAAINDNGEVTVASGPMRFETNTRQIEHIPPEQLPEGETQHDEWQDYGVDPVYMPSADIDVRGSGVQLVESMLRQFIDRAFMQGLSSVRIIHGRGTGAMREAVRDVLAQESQVSDWRNAPPDKGGDAATIVKLG